MTQIVFKRSRGMHGMKLSSFGEKSCGIISILGEEGKGHKHELNSVNFRPKQNFFDPECSEKKGW